MTQSFETPQFDEANRQNERAPDQNPLQRPGVPQELDPPRPLASAHWLKPDQQLSDQQPLIGQGLQLTPVFSTAVPARGLSGALRKAAYRLPDYKAKRWLLLMLADRVDVLEHRRDLQLKLLASAGLLGLGVFAAYRLRKAT